MAQGTSRLGSPEERELFAHSSWQGSGLTLIGWCGLCAQPEQLWGGGLFSYWPGQGHMSTPGAGEGGGANSIQITWTERRSGVVTCTVCVYPRIIIICVCVYTHISQKWETCFIHLTNI